MKTKEIIDEIAPLVSKTVFRNLGVRAFISKYSEKPVESIDWVEICRDVEANNCYKYGLILMIQLLKKGLYHGDYSEALYHNLPSYEKMLNQKDTHLVEAMCGNKISQQIVYNANRRKGSADYYSYMYINTSNPFVLRIIEQYLQNINNHGRYFSKEIAEVFGKSLGEYENAIHSATDFNSSTLFQQAEYYKTYFANDDYVRTMGLKVLVNFYRWLVCSNPDFNYFEGDLNMSKKLIFNMRLPELLDKDYYFTTLNPANIPYGKEKICFIMRGYENESTRLESDDYVSLNLSGLTCSFYRELLLEYIVTHEGIAAIVGRITGHYVIIAMEKIFQLKQDTFYPNKKIEYLTNQEAVFLRNYLSSQEGGLRTKNNMISAVRRFVAFCVDKGAITTDNLFFDYLTQYEEPNKNTAKAVPDDALVSIHQYLVNKSKNNLFYKEMLVIFHLAIQTEFRINQICHLQTDCIKPTIKPNQYKVVTNSKTSHGRKQDYVISTMTYNLLMDILEETESTRENCPAKSMKQYVFIYRQPKKNDIPVVFSDTIFTFTLKKICCELGINEYTASNLRDTHMTKSLEHIIRNGKSDIDMSVLSKHRYLDTTKNHYIEMELEKMLESTYGITIGTELIQTDSKVVDKIPENLVGEENDVENGCGKCTAEKCVMTGSLPCMACKHFITTPNHEVYFKKAIEGIDRLIKATVNRHDKEDLVTIKELYVLYLKAIISHKEGLQNAVSI